MITKTIFVIFRYITRTLVVFVIFWNPTRMICKSFYLFCGSIALKVRMFSNLFTHNKAHHNFLSTEVNSSDAPRISPASAFFQDLCPRECINSTIRRTSVSRTSRRSSHQSLCDATWDIQLIPIGNTKIRTEEHIQQNYLRHIDLAYHWIFSLHWFY